MLLSSLDINGLNGLRLNLGFFGLSLAQWQCYGHSDGIQKVGGSNLSGGYQETHVYHSPVLFSGVQHLLAISLSGVKIFAILVVANFANSNSNEQFCPLGYTIMSATLIHQGVIKLKVLRLYFPSLGYFEFESPT